nr:hypothetical protein [uncultured Draconibacterium sp.]
MSEQNIQLEKLRNIAKHFSEISTMYYQKFRRARKFENMDKYLELYRRYRNYADRAQSLIFKLSYVYTFGDGRKWYEMTGIQWLDHKKELKEKRKAEFESKYSVSVWFMQTSLRADYGIFTCSKCGAKFYHSPCDVYKGKSLITATCCGHCANRYFRNNGQDEVYH